MLLMIDNYDSFTYNLVQYFGELGEDVRVYRNNKISVDQIEALRPSRIVVSPGPCTPKEAGISVEAIRHFSGRLPLLGVCLGHQSLAVAFGGEVVRAERLMHGKTSQIRHDGKTIFHQLPNPFEATRYHSLLVNRATLPACFEVSAETSEGEIMGLRHRSLGVEGVQFHPESILTTAGKDLLRNFLKLSAVSTGGTSMIKDAIAKLADRISLTEKEASEVMVEIMEGAATPAQIAAYLMGLRLKGETVEEIAGSVRAMRDHAVRISIGDPMVVDTCGTGGDGAYTFNISTTAALVVAGAGLTVAKHGNRSVSSKSGSADVLTALGVKIDLSIDRVADCINEVGIGFLFAPLYHGAMKHCAAPRQEMGIRTMLNLLGPLTNPAGAPIQVVGVYESRLTELLGKVLMHLGSQHCFVVHGLDGLDEITLTNKTQISEAKGGVLKNYLIDPKEFGLSRISAKELAGGSPQENAAITRDILQGRKGPKRDVVCLNAAPALVAGRKAKTLQDGFHLAAEAIDSGAAANKLTRLIAATQRG